MAKFVYTLPSLTGHHCFDHSVSQKKPSSETLYFLPDIWGFRRGKVNVLGIKEEWPGQLPEYSRLPSFAFTRMSLRDLPLLYKARAGLW